MQALLQQRYPEAQVLALDIVEPMVQFIKQAAPDSIWCVCRRRKITLAQSDG